MMTDKRGYLVLIGGAEDKRGEMVILRKIMDMNHNGNVVVIPTATSYGRDAIRDYEDVFRSIGAGRVDGLDIQYRDEANREDYVDTLQEADVVFFTGGDQTRLVDALCKSKVMDAVRRKFAQGATIAGTSAGAAAVSDPMIYDGDDQGFSKHAVKHARGFGLLRDITVDTHFMQRERIPRLSQFLSSGKSKKGIGIDEDTAVFVCPDNTFEVVGRGVVTVMNADKLKYSNYAKVDRNEHISVDGVEIGFLAHGTVFDMAGWRIDKGKSVRVPRSVKDEIKRYRDKTERKTKLVSKDKRDSRRADYPRSRDTRREPATRDSKRPVARGRGTGRGNRSRRGRR